MKMMNRIHLPISPGSLRFYLALFVLFAISMQIIPIGSIFDFGKTSETYASGSSTTRARTVEFFIGQFSANGTTGKNTNTNNTLPDASNITIRLAETNVVVQNAYVEYEFQFSAYSAITIDSSTLTFDACVVSCTPNAWSGSGRASTTDSTVLVYSSGESNTARMYQNVTNEVQLAGYKGSASGSLAVQAGYRFRTASAANNIANASAKLVITYTYNENSPEVTNTVLYPLESQRSGDRGTQQALATTSCTIGSDCPAFSYNMELPEVSTSTSRIAQWFYVGGSSRANTTADQTLFVQIGANAGATTTLEQALSDNTGGYYWYFNTSTLGGFLENATQTLNVKPAGTNADMAIVGGEVAETYRASSSASVKTKTVRYGIGEINSAADLNKGTRSVNVFFPESGVSIKKAWVRLTTSFDGTATTRDLYVTTKVGSDAESSSSSYVVSCGVQCVSNDLKIFHVLPASSYTTLDNASATSSIAVTVSTQWSGAAKGATSGELVITYTYTGEAYGYQATHSIFATQQTSTPTSTWTGSGVNPVLPDTGGTLSIRSGFLEANMTYSELDGVPTADPTFGANLAVSGCSVPATSVKTSDTENTRFLLHKDVSSTISVSDSDSYQACYSSNSTGKFGGTLVYTYQNTFPYLNQTTYHWRDDDSLWDHVVTSTIDSAGAVGAYPSLAFTSSGIPIMSYTDLTNSRLKIAQCGNTECTSGNTTSSPDPNTSSASYSSIYVRDDGRPLVAYVRSSDGALLFLNCGNATCSSGNTTSSLMLESTLYPSMRIDSNGNPVIVGYKNSSGGFFLYRCGNQTCSSGNTSTTISADIGSYPSLVLTSTDVPLVVFYSFLVGLKFIHCGNAGCTNSSSRVLSGLGSPGQTSIQLDEDGTPSITFSGSGGVSLYRCDSASCSSGTSNVVGSGSDSSLALGVNASPFVSYYGGSSLNLGRCSNAECTSTSTDSMIIDSGGDIGQYSSLKLDSNNNPVIAYYNETNDDLRFAKVYLASSLTEGVPDTPYLTAERGQNYRLRLGIENTTIGSVTSTVRLEYGLNTGGSCSAISSWTTVGTPNDSSAHFVMASSSNMVDGSSTLDIPRANGGLTSIASTTFVGGDTRNTTSTTASLTFSSSSMNELEFAIKPTSNSTTSDPYCFRVTKQGTVLDAYASYPELQVASVPTISGLILNESNPIVLTANTTTSVSVNFSITDDDGCVDVFSSGNVTTTLFRTSMTNSCTEDTRNCYRLSSVTTHSCTASSTSANATTTFYIHYFADATDASSSYPSDSWRATVSFLDAGGLGNSSSSATTSLLTLVAIHSATSSINYGTLSPNTNTGSSNEIITLKNSGNATTTLRVNGTALTMGVESIATSSQHYATSSFTFGGSEAVLSDAATVISGVSISKAPIHTWRANTSLPHSIISHALIGTDTHLYAIGGEQSGSATTTVWYGLVSGSGTVVGWSATTPLPNTFSDVRAVRGGDFIYAAGNGTSTLLYAPINTNGTLGSWVETTDLPYVSSNFGLTPYDGYLYLSGGSVSGSNTSSVFYAPIGGDGSVGSWTGTTALPAARSGHSFFAYNDYLYQVGGVPGLYASSSFTPINGDGSLGSWTFASPFANLFMFFATAIERNGIVYILGGSGPTTNPGFDFMPLIPTPSSNFQWSVVSGYPTGRRDYDEGAATSDYLFVSGGYDSGGNPTSSVFSAPLPSDSIHWGVVVPNGAKAGTYSGTITIDSFYSQ